MQNICMKVLFNIYNSCIVGFQNGNSLRESCKLCYYLKVISRILQGRVFFIYSQKKIQVFLVEINFQLGVMI